MKLDLIAIRKLSPPGLLDLRGLAAMIASLQKLVCMPIGTPAHGRLYGRILAQFLRQLHQGERDNFHLRVKAWVMQCPRRIAFVRKIIGEPAIKRWRTNRLLDYALSQKCEDWQVVFKDGLDGFAALIGKNTPTNRPSKPGKPGKRQKSTYNWKPFALNKIPNALRILSGRSSPVYSAHANAPTARTLRTPGVLATQREGGTWVPTGGRPCLAALGGSGKLPTGNVTQTSFPRLRGKYPAGGMGGTNFVWRKTIACPPIERQEAPTSPINGGRKIQDSDAPTTDTPHRPKRKFPPVRFHPDELRPEAATGVPENMLEAPKTGLKIGAKTQPEIPPPPKPKAENHQENHKENQSKTHDGTTDPKPP